MMRAAAVPAIGRLWHGQWRKVLLTAALLGGGLGTLCPTASALEPSGSTASATTTVALTNLPREGRRTYRLILQGGPFPHQKDGATFGNYERQLPSARRGYYREYTVDTPSVRSRGARRIVCGGRQPATPDACYYTADHYSSFRKIVE
jgi:ribonuclease T1